MVTSRALLAVLLGLSATGTATAAEPLKVVATFSILGDMAQRIGGDRVAVTTLVGPNGDAHVYQPTPADAQAIAGADAVVVNGLGFEGFLDRLMDAAGYKGPVITATARVMPLPSEDAHDDHAGHEEHEGHDDHAEAHDDGHGHGHDHAKAEDHGHGHDDHAAAHDDHHGPHEEHAANEAEHDHGPLDPHAWQSLANGAAYVTAIAEGFCAADPDGCATFETNAATYRGEIEALDESVRSRIDAIPAERRQVITSHDAFRYFEDAYGVAFVAPQGVSTESEASARDVAGLIRQIRESGIKTVFVENIADPRLIRQIADETGASVGGALYSDALSGAGEPGATYLGMMKHNADALIAAMQQGS